MQRFLYSFEGLMTEVHSGFDAAAMDGVSASPAWEASEYPANSPDSRHSLNRFSHL